MGTCCSTNTVGDLAEPSSSHHQRRRRQDGGSISSRRRHPEGSASESFDRTSSLTVDETATPWGSARRDDVGLAIIMPPSSDTARTTGEYETTGGSSFGNKQQQQQDSVVMVGSRGAMLQNFNFSQGEEGAVMDASEISLGGTTNSLSLGSTTAMGGGGKTINFFKCDDLLFTPPGGAVNNNNNSNRPLSSGVGGGGKTMVLIMGGSEASSNKSGGSNVHLGLSVGATGILGSSQGVQSRDQIVVGTNLPREDSQREEGCGILSVGYVTFEPKKEETDDKIKAVGLRAALNAILYDDDDEEEEDDGDGGAVEKHHIRVGGGFGGLPPPGNGIRNNSNTDVNPTGDGLHGIGQVRRSMDSSSARVGGRVTPKRQSTRVQPSPERSSSILGQIPRPGSSSNLRGTHRSPCVLQSFEDTSCFNSRDDDSDSGNSVTSSHAVDGRGGLGSEANQRGKKGKHGGPKDLTVVPHDSRQAALMMAHNQTPPMPSNGLASAAGSGSGGGRNSSANYALQLNSSSSKAKLGSLRQQMHLKQQQPLGGGGSSGVSQAAITNPMKERQLESWLEETPTDPRRRSNK